MARGLNSLVAARVQGERVRIRSTSFSDQSAGALVFQNSSQKQIAGKAARRITVRQIMFEASFH
jgi:hypothetical protein